MRGIHNTATQMRFGISVERVFPVHSPVIYALSPARRRRWRERPRLPRTDSSVRIPAFARIRKQQSKTRPDDSGRGKRGRSRHVWGVRHRGDSGANFGEGLGRRLCGRGGRGRCRNAGGAWTSVHASVSTARISEGLAHHRRDRRTRGAGLPDQCLAPSLSSGSY